MVFLVIEANSQIETALRSLVEHGTQLGFTLIKALAVFLVGRLIINLLNKLLKNNLLKNNLLKNNLLNNLLK